MLIKPQTKCNQVRYVDYISSDFVGPSSPQHKSFHIIQSSSGAFTDLYAAIRRYFRDEFDERIDRGNIFLLLDIFYVNYHKAEDSISPSLLAEKIKGCDLSLLVVDSCGLVFSDSQSLAELQLCLSLPGGSKKLRVLARGIDVLALKTAFTSLELSDDDPASAIIKHASVVQGAPVDLLAASELIKTAIIKSGLDELAAFESRRRLAGDQDLEEEHYRLLLKGAQMGGLAGSYAEAMPLMEQALTLCSKSFGSEDEEMATCEHNMAQLLRLQGRFQRAEAHQRRALFILESVVNGPRDEEGDRVSPNPFAVSHVNQNDHPEAHKITVYLSALGRILRGQGKLVEAESVLRRALAVKDHAAEVRIKAGNGCTSRYEEEDEESIWITHDLAAVCLCQGKNEEAFVLHMRSIKAMQCQVKQKNGTGSKKANALAQYLMKLARQWQDAKGLVEAVDLYEEADFEFSRVSGSSHPMTLTCLFFHADALRQMKRVGEALALARLAYDGRGKVLGPEHTLTIESLDQVIFLLLEKKDFDAAEPLMRKALGYLEQQARKTTADRPLAAKLASRQHGLARLLDVRSAKTGLRAEEADAVLLYSRSLATRQAIMGGDHRDTLSSLSCLALLEARVGTHAKEHGINDGSLEKAANHSEQLVEILLRKAEAGVVEDPLLVRHLVGLTSVLTQMNQAQRLKPLLCSIDRAIDLKKGGGEEDGLKKIRLLVSEAIEKHDKDLQLSKKVAVNKNRGSTPVGFLTGLGRVKRMDKPPDSSLLCKPSKGLSGAYTPRTVPQVPEKSPSPPSPPLADRFSSFSDRGMMRERRISTPISLMQESSASSLESDHHQGFSHGHSFPPASPTHRSAANLGCALPPIAAPPALKRKDTRSVSTDRPSRHTATVQSPCRSPISAAFAPFQFIRAFIPLSNRD